MSDAVKIGTALAGGYLLGRTRKAKTALGLALYLTGKGRPRDWARQGMITLAQTPEFQDLLKQVRGPLMTSAKGAAGSTLTARLNSLSDDLNRRTSTLSGEQGGSPDTEAEPEREDDSEATAQKEESGKDADSGRDADSAKKSSGSSAQRSGSGSSSGAEESSRKPPARQQAG